MGDSSRYWGAFNIITQLAFMNCLILWMDFKKKNTKCERLYLRYVFAMTLFRVFYTLTCVYASRTWIIYNTDLFTLIVTVTFAATIIYSVFKYRNEFG